MNHPVVAKKFKNTGADFSAWTVATRWLKERGYVVGEMQRDAPVGVHHESECAGISKWRDLAPAERSMLHGKITWNGGGPREGDALLTFVSNEDDAAIPMEKWGRDHWSTFSFVCAWFISWGSKGFPIRQRADHMRTDTDLHPEMAGRRTALLGNTKKYPTRLREGEIDNHDDWSCLEDIEAAGLVRREGTGVDPVIFLTEAGAKMHAALEGHRARGGTMSDFEGSAG